MLKDGLYHSDVYMPKLKVSSKNIRLSYTQHAIFASQSDRYNTIRLPEVINLSQGKIIELEVVNSKPHKLVVRLPYDAHCDICIVMLVAERIVKTVWLNRSNDTHRTLDRSKYIQG